VKSKVVTLVLDMVLESKASEDKEVNRKRRIQYKMAAGRKYKEKDKFVCLYFIVLKSPIERSYIDGSV
jgi:hypothetical protein